MKLCMLHHTSWQIFLLHVISHLLIHFVNESNAKLGHVGWAKSDSRTKQILQNIRTHLAQQSEVQQQKECDSKIFPCNVQKKGQAEEEESLEEGPAAEQLPPFRLRTRPRSTAQMKRDVAMSIRDREAKKKTNDETAKSKKLDKKLKGDKDDREKDKDKKEKSPVKRLVEISQHEEKKEEEDETMGKAKKLELKKKKLETSEATEKSQRIEKTKIDKTQTQNKQSKIEIKQKLDKIEKPSKKSWSTENSPKKEKDMTIRTERPKRETQEKVKKIEDEEEEARFPEDIPVFSLASDSVNSEQCRQHSRVYLRQLKRYKIWALMMYDSTAKFPSGLLQGNVNQYGDFDQCLSVNATFKKKNRDGVSGIQGKYCLATIDVSYTESANAGLRHAVDRTQSFAFVKSNINDTGHFIPRFSTINWGLCIPSTCKAEDLENSIKSNLDGYKKKSGLKFDVKVEDRNCVTKMDLLSDYDLKTYITLLFYISIIGVAIYATLRDTHKRNRNSELGRLQPGTESKEVVYESIPNDNEDEERTMSSHHGILKSLLMAFSLKRNMKKLFIEGESEDNIDCVHGLKSIFTVMLYFAHKTIPLALTPFSNRVVLTELSNESTSILLRGSMIYTDSFLLISGTLTSFNLCKEIKTKGRIRWIRRIISRYIRLTPALLATVLFYAYISSHLGSGPMWNVVVEENSRLCRQHFWKNLLFIQNFFPFEEMCAPQTHQLALDMQLFLLSPLLVYLLHKYDKIGIGILQALLMVSSILRFTSTLNNELSLIIYHGMPVTQLYKTANLLYIKPIYRATPYIIGVFVGYYLQKIGKEFKLPNLLAAFCWIISLCLAASSLITPAHLSKQDYEYDEREAAHYAALSPIAWSVALAWFITACYSGYGDKINQYLSCKGFLIFSRISYSVYLTQFLVFSYGVGSKRIPEMFSIRGSVDIVEIIFVVIISIAMTLLFDIPTVEIKTIILSLIPDVSACKEGKPGSCEKNEVIVAAEEHECEANKEKPETCYEKGNGDEKSSYEKLNKEVDLEEDESHEVNHDDEEYDEEVEEEYEKEEEEEEEEEENYEKEDEEEDDYEKEEEDEEEEDIVVDEEEQNGLQTEDDIDFWGNEDLGERG